MITKEEIKNLRDLVTVTFSDLYRITADYEKEMIKIYCWFLNGETIVELPVVELMEFKNSASGYFGYLKGEMTKQLSTHLNLKSKEEL